MGYRSRLRGHLSASRISPGEAAVLEEGYARERRTLYSHLLKQEALGRIQPPATQQQNSLPAEANLPALAEGSELIKAIRSKQGEQLAILHASQSLETAPGMVFTLPADLPSNMQRDYANWERKEGGLLEAQRRLDGRHNRCKNDISDFVEASARYHLIMKSAGGQGKAGAKA